MPQPLSIPYHPQKADGYCLAAYAQMVLHYWGVAAEQEEIAQELGIIPGVGAPAGRIVQLRFPQIAITYDAGDWDILQVWLDKGVPVIVMLQAGELPNWQGEYFQHAVVVIEHDGDVVQLLDPAMPPDAITVSIDEFMLAWGEMDYRYAVLEQR